MDEAIKAIKEEREKNRYDVYHNTIPKRVPIEVGLTQTVVADYAGVDRIEAYWDPSLLKEAAI